MWIVQNIQRKKEALSENSETITFMFCRQEKASVHPYKGFLQ